MVFPLPQATFQRRSGMHASISENHGILEMIEILEIISSSSLVTQIPLKILFPEPNAWLSPTNLVFFQCSQSKNDITIHWVILSRNQGPILEDHSLSNVNPIYHQVLSIVSHKYLFILSICPSNTRNHQLLTGPLQYSNLFPLQVFYSKLSNNHFLTQIW